MHEVLPPNRTVVGPAFAMDPRVPQNLTRIATWEFTRTSVPLSRAIELLPHPMVRVYTEFGQLVRAENSVIEADLSLTTSIPAADDESSISPCPSRRLPEHLRRQLCCVCDVKVGEKSSEM
eukprot:m.97348 g.97348  ORF g.97348 m.97348 type:complete len:121 (-) comp12395_c0_seq2:70-432(-)